MPKKILITGTKGYIGTSLKKWLMKDSNKYEVDFINVRDDFWKYEQFEKYDVIFHAAGIAHQKENEENKSLYYEINRDLAYQIAEKAKVEKVKNFIFVSTMSVYGLNQGIIDNETPLKPNNAYGKSKLEAEILIRNLQDHNFNVSIIRPPMVYGKGCVGNYTRLAKLALATPIFPNISNKRSMIYIDNLSEFVKKLIEKPQSGIFFPQNSEYVNSSEMVKKIAISHKKTIYLSSFFNPLLKVLNLNILNKVFGDLYYKKEMSQQVDNYNVFNFDESIKMTEDVNIEKN